MRRTSIVSLLLALAACGIERAEPERGATAQRGVLLEELTWVEAEAVLSNDWIMAEYLKERVLEEADVVVAPTLPYHYYPAFFEYPGSTSLRVSTARDLVVDVLRTLAAFGPRRFYVLNTGVSTLRALRPAADTLAADGILLHYTDILEVAADVEREVAQEEGGTHAEEIETSMMLYIAPWSVDMSKAAKDYHPAERGPLRRDSTRPGIYSATGIYGDATLANREKGRRVVEATVEGILRDIERLRGSTPPQPHAMGGPN